jgi:2-polyprenyl-3-methyl-5-hydroxy-6-metoxy-1,4-benzoquinol methylase
MDRDQVASELRGVIDTYGPWNAYNFELADDVYTQGSADTSAVEPRLSYFTQLVSDLSPRPINELRVLDLACLEGIFALEFAKRGAEVVGIEGRQAHIERAQFAARALGIDRVEFMLGDVRDLNAQTYGRFDVVLCLGILYHLDAHDLLPFLQSIADVCRGFAVIDTHLSLHAKQRFDARGVEYWGRSYPEHDPDSTAERREQALRASLDNLASFWFTKRSLLRALAETGFTTCLEAELPVGVTRYLDRSVVVAMRGSPTTPELVPGGNPAPSARSWPERDPRRVHRSQDWRENARTRIARVVPKRARDYARSLRRRS